MAEEWPLSSDGERLLAPGHERCGRPKVAKCDRFDEVQSSTGCKAVCPCGAVFPLRVRNPGEGSSDS